MVDRPPVHDSIPISGLDSSMRYYLVQLIVISPEMDKHHLHVGLMLNYMQNYYYFLFIYFIQFIKYQSSTLLWTKTFYSTSDQMTKLDL